MPRAIANEAVVTATRPLHPYGSWFIEDLAAALDDDAPGMFEMRTTLLLPQSRFAAVISIKNAKLSELVSP